MIPENKVFFITGASSGIGREISILLSKEKCSLALLARRTELLNQLSEQLSGAQAEVKTYTCDVTDKNAVESVINKVKEHFGRIDVAILNSGVGYKASAEDIDTEKAKAVFDVNLFGIINCLEILVPYFIKAKSGMIAGVTSLADSRGWPGSGFYVASKAAGSKLLESLRVGLKKYNIKVITIKPGFVKTELTAKNKFMMPFIMDADKAAKIIVNGLKKEKKIIQFPLPTVLGAKLTRIVPDFLINYFATKESSYFATKESRRDSV
jgi:short-subunit dehydrogenase